MFGNHFKIRKRDMQPTSHLLPSQKGIERSCDTERCARKKQWDLHGRRASRPMVLAEPAVFKGI